MMNKFKLIGYVFVINNHVKLAAFMPVWHERCELDMIPRDHVCTSLLDK